MLNVLLAGVGGQGTVLAAKLLAQAALEKGWQVRTAETIGMAQRGGNVVSHVRIGDKGETVHASLVSRGMANLVIAFEPAEAARVLRATLSTSSAAPSRESSFSRPYSSSASTVLSPMARLGSLMIRRVEMSSSGLTSARM